MKKPVNDFQDLEQELQFTRENLQATIEELETSNEELQATNEELLASNEELQSTNEELQSTNEELYTVNAEHQNKIIELAEALNDVENLLSSSRIGTLILDEDMCIRRYSPQAAEVFNLVDGDIGRPLTHLSHRLSDFDAVDFARKAQRDGKTIEREARDNTGHWFLVRTLPYRVGPQMVVGVVITLVDITEQKLTQKKLEESESYLRSTLDGLSAHIAVIDERGEIILTNKAYRDFAKQNGASPMVVSEGTNYLDVCDMASGADAEEAGLFSEGIREVLSGKRRIFEFEYPCHSPDEQRWFIGRVTPAAGNDSRRVIVAHENITERKQAEESLRESEALLSRSQEIARVGSWKLNLTTNHLFWSDEVYRIFGCDPQEFPATYEAFLGFVHPDDRAEVDEAYFTSLRDGSDGYEIEHRIVQPDTGKLRYVHERCVHQRDDAGKIIESTGMVQDITERKQAEESLQESEERHSHLYRVLADAEKVARMGSWTFDVATDTVTWSENLFHLFGRDPVSGAPSLAEHNMLYSSESIARLSGAVQKALQDGIPYEMELEALRNDKTIMRCIARGQAETNGDGEVQRLHGSLQEIPS